MQFFWACLDVDNVGFLKSVVAKHDRRATRSVGINCPMPPPSVDRNVVVGIVIAVITLEIFGESILRARETKYIKMFAMDGDFIESVKSTSCHRVPGENSNTTPAGLSLRYWVHVIHCIASDNGMCF